MKLQIKKIIDFGTYESEKVLMDVCENTELYYYILRDTTYIGNFISNKWVHSYHFAKQVVKAGDKVVLYTKSGTNSTKDLGNGKTEYIFYWGLKNSIWNNEGDAAVLYQVSAWHTVGVNKK